MRDLKTIVELQEAAGRWAMRSRREITSAMQIRHQSFGCAAIICQHYSEADYRTAREMMGIGGKDYNYG